MRERLRNLSIIVIMLTCAANFCLAEELLRDPTRPYIARESYKAAPPRFTVNTIIVSAERRVAIVNGRRVVVGGSVDGATVIAIEKDQLVLEKNGKRITVGLNQ